MLKIYIPKNNEIRQQLEYILARQDIDKLNNIYPMTFYIFLTELSEEEFNALSLSSEEHKTGNIIIYDNGEVYIIDNEQLLKTDNFLIMNCNELAITENQYDNVRIDITFPNVGISYYANEIPILNDILNHKFVQEEYQKIFTEKEFGILMIEIKTNNEGKEYYYDVVNKIWYFAENISSLNEDKEKLEQHKCNYSQAKIKFKKIQNKKILSIIIVVILMTLLLLLDIKNVFASMGLLIGQFYVVLMILNLLLSNLNFENTGGYKYFPK